MRSILGAWHSGGMNLFGTVLYKVAKFITAVTLGIRAVVAKMSCLSTYKISIITGHHVVHGRFQCGCIEFFNKSDYFSQGLRVLFMYFSCDGRCFSKSLSEKKMPWCHC